MACWPWIDALAIKQKGTTERTRQVVRMGDMYDNARFVFSSCLGQVTEDMDSVFEFINGLFTHTVATRQTSFISRHPRTW